MTHCSGKRLNSHLKALAPTAGDWICWAYHPTFELEDSIVLPPRTEIPHVKPLSEYQGGLSQRRPIRVGVSGCYEHITNSGYLFTNMTVANGHNSLKPWCDLYQYGLTNGIEFVSLDGYSVVFHML